MEGLRPIYINIKKLRQELNMSQDELAKKTGYTDRSSIAKIETGSVDLGESKIEIFAKALNTTPAKLYGWTEPETIAAHNDNEEWTEAEKNEIARFKKWVKSKRGE